MAVQTPPVVGQGPKDEVNERLDKWLRTATRLGYELKHDQVEALRCLATTNDVLYVLATGAGKSLVYLLPLLTSDTGEAAPLALYIAPLNSLIEDQHKKSTRLAKKLELPHFAVRGGRRCTDDVETDEEDGASSGDERDAEVPQRTPGTEPGQCGRCRFCLLAAGVQLGAGRPPKKCREKCDLKALNEARMTPCAGCASSGLCVLKAELERRRQAQARQREARARDAGDEPAEAEAQAEAAVHRVTRDDIAKLPPQAAEQLLQRPDGPRLLEVTPEQLVAPTHAGEVLRQALVLCGRWRDVIVDEAHCGRRRDAKRYRAAYEQVGSTLAELKARHEALHGRSVRTVLCTATVAPCGEEEVLTTFDVDPQQVVTYRGELSRHNIAHLTVQLPMPEAGAGSSGATRDRYTDVVLRSVRLLELSAPAWALKGKRVLFVMQARQALAGAAALTQGSHPAVAYCTGKRRLDDGSTAPLMTAKEKRLALRAWRKGDAEYMVATEAFGLGNDEPDISLVGILKESMNVEAYAQETGRAGRDGSRPALVVALKHPRELADRLLLTPPERADEHAAIAEAMRVQREPCCVHATLAEHFGGRPGAVWSGCCSSCLLQGSARLGGGVDSLKVQLDAAAAKASEEHMDAGAALAKSLLVRSLSCREGRAAALEVAARVDNFEEKEGGSPKLSAVYYDSGFRPSFAPFNELSHHAALVDTMLARGLLTWAAHPLPHKPEGSYARVGVNAVEMRRLSGRNASLLVLLYGAPPPRRAAIASGSASGSDAGDARAEAALLQEAMAHASTLTRSVASLRRLLRATRNPDALLEQLPHEVRQLVLPGAGSPKGRLQLTSRYS